MIHIEKYTAQNKSEWDNFVNTSKNGTFLLLRDYMEYHSDRFVDFSLMAYDKHKLIAMLPACIVDDTVISHGGLTYGGWVMSAKSCTASIMLSVFESMLAYLKSNNITSLIYKPIPYIYHIQPAQEDMYALYRCGATKSACAISSVIDTQEPLRFNENSRRAMRRATEAGISVQKNNNYTDFWQILSDNLSHKFHTMPVHSVTEIEMLTNRFPDNIELYTAVKEDKVIAGCVVYNTKKVAHIQYISASEEGKQLGALPLIFSHIIEQSTNKYRYVDFGISTENSGNYLNEGLISQKEGFGGRAVMYEAYTITI